MGIYLNPGAAAFEEARHSEIYVDKTGLIEKLNRVLGTTQKYVCASRPRRFGKTMAANMACAYYDRTVEASAFDNLKIAESDGLALQGKFDVLRINMQEFVSETSSIDDLLELFAENPALGPSQRISSLPLLQGRQPAHGHGYHFAIGWPSVRDRHRRMGLYLPRIPAR